MELFIGLVGLVGAALIFIATMLIIIMLHEQKKEQQKELNALALLVKADNKEAFRQIIKQELQPLCGELDYLVEVADILAEGTIALMEQVEGTLDEECECEKDEKDETTKQDVFGRGRPRKQITVLDVDTDEETKYDSIQEFAELTGIKVSACRGAKFKGTLLKKKYYIA